MKRLRDAILLGIVLPAVVYIGWLELADQQADRDTPAARAAELGIDVEALDPDVLSPRVADALGLVSLEPTTEYVVVFLSATWCSGSTYRGLSESIRRLEGLIDSQVNDREDAVVRMVGVSLDTDPSVGLSYLARFGPFDEVVAGGSWLNFATEKLFWDEMPVSGELPQVVVMERRVRFAPYLVTVGEERILRSVIGARAIVEWVADGAWLEVEG